MLITLDQVEFAARDFLNRHGHESLADRAAEDCAWLEAVGYPGLKILAEAVMDETQNAVLEKDLMGLDLQNVSCVFLADQIAALNAEHGRIFLRNVRHGLYLVPLSVRGNFGIGCPVDPGFALGGERTKNPYPEKIDTAMREGVTVDDAVWSNITTGQ